MLISAAVDILTCELGIFSLKINWEKSRLFGVGNGTVYRYQLYKEKKPPKNAAVPQHTQTDDHSFL
jgi:hypothetical protein